MLIPKIDFFSIPSLRQGEMAEQYAIAALKQHGINAKSSRRQGGKGDLITDTGKRIEVRYRTPTLHNSHHFVFRISMTDSRRGQKYRQVTNADFVLAICSSEKFTRYFVVPRDMIFGKLCTIRLDKKPSNQSRKTDILSFEQRWDLIQNA